MKRLQFNRFLLSSVVGMTALLTASGAQAAEGTGGQLEEIVVTARKASEKLQSTPVAVTAITATTLDKKQIQTIADLQRSAPNVSITLGGAGPSTLVYIAIRGEAQNSPNSAADNAVGIYVDGVYLARATGGNVDMFDVQRAEILRGPQGTLFGRNTIGGALNIVSKAPTNRFEGYVKAGVGNYDQRLVETVINVPLSSEVAARGAFRYQEHSGYGYNPIQNKPLGDVLGDYYGRMQVKWSPENAPMTLTLSTDYQNFRDSGEMYNVSGVNPQQNLGGITLGTVLGLANFDPTPYILNSNNFYNSYGNAHTGNALIDNPHDFNRQAGVAANLDWDIGELHLKSVTAYRETNTHNALDLDGLPADLFAFYSQYDQHQFSQEFNLSGHLDRLDWLAGVYYFVEKGHETSLSQGFGIFSLPALGGANIPINSDDADFRSTSAALFAQVNYHLTDKLRATGGFRYTWDTRTVILHNNSDITQPVAKCVITTDVAGTCSQNRTAHFKYPAWTAGLDYQATDELFLYAKTSGASMAGGWNTRVTNIPAFSPENVRDVEVGFKADLLDRKLRTNMAFFYAWQGDVQRIVNAYVPSLNRTTQFVQNAGKAKVYGVEFEATALPWDGMEINSGVALLNAKYKKGSFLDTQTSDIDGLDYPIDRSAEPIPHSPKFTMNIAATQTFDIPIGSIAAHVDYSYISSRVYYSATAGSHLSPSLAAQYAVANDLGRLKGYGLLNARLALNILEPDVEISLWGRNLTKEKYATYSGDFYTGFGIAQWYQGAPRTYGVTVAYHW